MLFKQLIIVSKWNIEAYALPAHTSTITQILDVAEFSHFKAHINENIYNTTEIFMVKHRNIQKLDICNAIH